MTAVEPDPLLTQTRLTEGQARGLECISLACRTPDAALIQEELLTARVDGVIRVLPVRRCQACVYEQQGITVIVDSSRGGA